MVRRRGGSRVVLEALLAVQALHLAEHVVQMLQLYALGWPPAAARGVVSTLDIEKVHFVWNLIVLATLVWLVRRRPRCGWLVATLVWALLHTSEHGFLLARALVTGVEGAPGILGAAGWLERHGWTIPGLTTWSRATVHFAWNTIEVALLTAAYAVAAHRRVWWRGRPTLASAERGAVLAFVVLVPSTVTAPAETISALAPLEVWVDGFATVTGVVVDRDGALYVSDRDAGTVTRVAPDRHRTVVASGLGRPMGLALDKAGRLLVAEEDAGRVVRIETNGARAPIASGLRRPRWLATAEDGALFVSARGAPRGDPDDEPMTVLRLQAGGALEVFADDFKQLEGIVADDGALFVAARGRRDSGGGEGVIFRIGLLPNGSAGAVTAHGPLDRFKTPLGLARDPLGALYLTTPELDTARPKPRDAVAKLHPAGAVTLFAADLRDPQGVTFDLDGNLYVADGRAGRVLRFRAPRRPTLDPVPAATNRSPLPVSGTVDGNARTDLFVNNAATPLSVVADAAGRFVVEAALAPNTRNALEVFAIARGGDGLTSPAAEAQVIHDGAKPAVVFLGPAAGAFVRQTVTVQSQATDGGTGVASVAMTTGGAALPADVVPQPPAATVTATAAWNTTAAVDGAHTLSAVGVDRAGNVQSVTRVVVVDNTPPDTQITDGPSGDVQDTAATFTFAGTDNLTPGESLVFAWRLDGEPVGAFSAARTATFAALSEGGHTFEVKARDSAGNEDTTPAVRRFTVNVRPRVTGLSPSNGPVGTLVTVTGLGFVPGGTDVSFNGVPAIVRSVAPTTLTATVPLDARSGPVTVTTPRGSGTSTQPFTVTATQDFSVQAVPAAAQLVPGTSATYTISLVNADGAAFSGLAALTVTGLPPGVTGAFAPSATASGGQLRTLTLTASPSAAPALATVTIAASAFVDGVGVTRAATATVGVVAAGRTAVLGQVTLNDGAPLAGARFTLAGMTTTSDAGGNFQLIDVPAGQQMLGIDANVARPGLPIYGVEVTLGAGQATQLAPLRITPPPVPERFVPIVNTTTAQVVTDPRFPGASVTLPAGVTITGWDGAVKTRIALERLFPDALPVPPPPGATRSLYQVFFGTPMGGLPSAPLPVTVPNDQDLEPGDKAEIWYYDAAPVPGVPAGWRLAGLGTVSPDGSRVVSDPGVGISRFCGVCGVFCIIKNLVTQANINPHGPRAGEPVDLGSGLMLVDTTDLVLPGRLPAVLRRAYNPQDPFGRIAGFELATGPGWRLSIDVVLLQESPSLRRLILPGNARFPFTLQPDGTFANTTFLDFAGAVLSAQSDGGHTLRFKDGTLWRFATGYVPRVGQPIPIVGLSLLTARTDRNGNVLTIARDQFGAPTRVTEPGGRSLTFTVELVGAAVARLLAVTDPVGRVVRYGYTPTAPFRLDTATDPTGGVTRYAYDPGGGIVGITGPRGIVVLTNEHDTRGRVVRQTQPDGGVWTFAYAGPVHAHTSATVTDPEGHHTTYRLDGAGFLVETIDALGQSTRDERDPVGRLTQRTDPLGRTTRLAYDQRGNPVRITDAAGRVRMFAYEPTFSRVTAMTDPVGGVTAFEYDGAGNLTAIADPLGHRATITYDVLGQPISATDPLGNVSRLDYDAVGNVTAFTDAVGNRTRHEYDAVSRPVRRLDPLGRAITFGYDSLDRVETVLDPLGGVTRFAYDASGNVVTLTDARGSVTSYTYDAMDRLATRTDPVGATESFAYDRLGNPTRHTDRKGQTAEFTYDPLSRRIESRYPDATASSVYDAGGRLVQIGDSTGGTILNRYDALDRLVAQTTSLGTIAYLYDALGRRSTMTAPGEAPVTYGYDPASRLTAVAQGTQLAELEYDRAGRRTRLTLPNRVSTEYRYDPASRLTALIYRNAAGVLGDLVYRYDATGNRIAVGGSFARTLLPDPVPTATYDAANRQLTFGDHTMTYDANGNVTSMTTPSAVNRLVWDSRDRLIQLTTPAARLDWTYDPEARRINSRAGQVEARHLYDHYDIVHTHTPENGTSFLRTPALDEPLSRDVTDFYLADALGSTVALTNSVGAITTRYLYEPFGLTTVEGPGSPNPFEFAGRENDQDAGLYSYRLRPYSPLLHRFLSEDRLGWLVGANGYVYFPNNPLSFTDPFGLDVTIRRYGAHGPNPFGHIAISVDHGQTFGFYPARQSVEVALGESVPGVIRVDTAEPLSLLNIATNHQQDRMMRGFIIKAIAQPARYNYYTNNCAHFVADVLRAAGIQVVNVALPAHLMLYLRLRYGTPDVTLDDPFRPVFP